jgi:hypothetical protein
LASSSSSKFILRDYEQARSVDHLFIDRSIASY